MIDIYSMTEDEQTDFFINIYPSLNKGEKAEVYLQTFKKLKNDYLDDLPDVDIRYLCKVDKSGKTNGNNYKSDVVRTIYAY